jgi:putative ABC transport system substrate-binding protein
MRRRDFIKVITGSAAVWPLAARAQQPTMPVVGFLGSASGEVTAERLRAFREGLKEAGYLEGRNVEIEYLWAEGNNDRLPALAARLVRRQVAVIVAAGGTPSAFAAKAATTTIPIIFGVAVDPVALGLVDSLNQPGGNLTGVTNLNVEVAPKRLELLRELLPSASLIAVLVNPTNPAIDEPFVRELQAAAPTLGLKLHVLHASGRRFRFGVCNCGSSSSGRTRDRPRSILDKSDRTACPTDVPPPDTRDLPASRVRRGWRPGELRQ